MSYTILWADGLDRKEGGGGKEAVTQFHKWHKDANLIIRAHEFGVLHFVNALH
jgi:hypothetical protein